jgi:predicted transcriptional regulator
MTIELKPELEARLREAARRDGLEPEALAVRAIEEKLPPDPLQRILWNGMTVAQWIRETRTWALSHSDWPLLPDEAYQREDWYGDRG